MWFIWLAVFLILCFAGMIVFWIGHKIWMAIKRDEKKFQKEFEKAEVDEDE